jgi:hypothetical protein
MRKAERELAQQAETAYAHTVREWQAATAAKAGASVTPGRASSGLKEPSHAADHKPLTSALRYVIAHGHQHDPTRGRDRQQHLIFISKKPDWFTALKTDEACASG